MPWIIHKENVHETLKQRLESGSYSNSEHPFLESRFVIPLLKYFPRGDEYLAEYHEHENIICAFVMSRYSSLAAGSYVEGVCQISLTYIDSSVTSEKLQALIPSLFKSLPGYFLALNFELQDPDLINAAVFSEMNNAEVVESANNTSIPAGLLFEDYWGQRSKSMRKDIARRLRVVERAGIEIAYKVVANADELDEAYAEYCRLESTGWKGDQGTALTNTNTQGKFYKEVVSGFMNTGEAKFYQLLFDQTIVASLIVIENKNMMIVIKTSYDEEFAKFSPGRLLDYYMLKDILNKDNMKHIENYTNASEVDQKWFPRLRQMYDVTIYRSNMVKQLAQLRRKIRG